MLHHSSWYLSSYEKTFYLGTEYKYWKNKFGLEGITEEVWQILAQVQF